MTQLFVDLEKIIFSSSLYKAIFNLKTFMLGKLGKLELFIYWQQ